MGMNLDPNAIYPAGTILLFVVGALIGLKLFARPSDLLEMEARIAEKYVLKDDIEKKLDDIKKDFRDAFQDIKVDMNRIFDKLDNFIRQSKP